MSKVKTYTGECGKEQPLDQFYKDNPGTVEEYFNHVSPK